jgi:hypothetical protein
MAGSTALCPRHLLDCVPGLHQFRSRREVGGGQLQSSEHNRKKEDTGQYCRITGLDIPQCWPVLRVAGVFFLKYVRMATESGIVDEETGTELRRSSPDSAPSGLMFGTPS